MCLFRAYVTKAMSVKVLLRDECTFYSITTIKNTFYLLYFSKSLTVRPQISFFSEVFITVKARVS